MGATTRVPIRREITKDRATQKLQQNAQAAANAVNALAQFRQIVEAGDAPGDVYTSSDPAWNTITDSFTTTSYVDSSTCVATIAAALKAGDQVLIFGHLWVTVGATTVANFRVAITDGANLIEYPRSYANLGAITVTPVPVSGRYVMQNDTAPGACIVRVQGNRQSGSNAVSLLSASGFSYLVLR